MSADGSSQQRGDRPDLQFDTAESHPGNDASAIDPHAALSLNCSQCGTAIVTSYYEVNGAVVCPRCRGALHAGSSGSRATRAFKATGLGLLAAAGGSLLYFAIAAITGYEFGLVAIAVGFVVGKAVRKGSGNRGGWAYQTLAVVLTYFAIVSTYIPLAVKEFRSNPAAADSLRVAMEKVKAQRDSAIAADSLAELHDSTTSSATARTTVDSGFPVSQAGEPASATRRHPFAPRAKRPHIGVGLVLLGIVGMLLFAAVVPILAGFSNIIGLIIIGIAVFQAWKLNKRTTLEITGPYRVVKGAAASG